VAEELENHALRMLEQIDAKLDAILGYPHEFATRKSSVKDQFVGSRADFARLKHTMNRFDDRLIRIERRLDLIEA
jgi:hypothetical protein